MWSSEDLDAAERRIDDWQAGIERRAAQAVALSGRIADISATARSDDGSVEVTVASSGVVTELRLSEAIRNRAASETSRQIMAVIGQAQAALTSKVVQATEETVGLADPAGQAIVDSYTKRSAQWRESGSDAGR